MRSFLCCPFHVFALFISLAILGGSALAKEPGMPPTVAPGAQLVEVYGADSFFEGPTWDPKGGKLYFTSFPSGQASTQILRLESPGKVTVWLDRTEGVNGTYLSVDGRLLGAQAYGHRVMSYAFGADGPADTKVLYHNAKLNQPNDVCQTPAGHIYFTDPDWTKKQTSAVYHLNAQGRATKVISDMPLPNGVKASPDGRTLYVGDSELLHWKSFPINDDGSLGAGRVFLAPPTDNKDAEVATPDGMAVDEHGNLYLSGHGGVWAASPQGKILGFIDTPTFCSNAAFGGAQGKTLYLTCAKHLYSLEMTVCGAPTTRTSGDEQ